MTLRITASEIDSLVKVSERPEPIPLPLGSGLVPVNPMVFPVDWGFGCTVTTRWQTDVTRSMDRRRVEKWALSSRPVRSLEVTVVGASREEAFAMQMAALGMSTQLGCPVPIYTDMAEISSVSGTAVVEAFGDFRFRRFFPGGRVCFMPNEVRPAAGENSVVFGTLLEIAPGYMKVQMIAEAMREITTSDIVMPCMDVELVEKASGLSITDAVYQLTLSWNELEGASSLPASWPFINSTSADLASPLCKVVGSLPVFPFNPDWSDGVEIEIVRETGSDKSGRTSVQEPVGDPYHRFMLSVMGYNREACWKVSRFFDAVRGRAASFYLIHPQAPWKLLSFPTLSQVSIAAVGSLSGMGFYKKIVLQRSDGSLIVRDISSIASAGGGSIFVLLLSSPLPDTSFVSAQPIFVCSFDQDDLEEAWATSGVVPAFRLGIVEEPDYGTAPIPSLGYAQQSPGFLGISGCNLLLRAGVGCLTASGAPSTVWSGTDAYVSKIVDESQSVVRMPTKLQVFKALDVASGNNTANLVRWSAPWQNNGQPSIRDASYTLSHQTFTGRPVGDRHLWSVTNGWTLFLCWTPQNRSVVASDTTLFRIVSPELELHFKHDTAGASGAGRSRLVVNTVTAHLLTQEMTNANYPTIVTLHISSAGSLRIWVNGTQACAPSLTLSLPNVSGYSVSEWFTFLNTNRPTTSPILANEWGVSGAMNLMLSYDRGLDISEINQVHELIADIYKTAVTPSSLF